VETQSAVQGAIFAELNFGIGQITSGAAGASLFGNGAFAANVGLHAALGCAQQAAAGGHCKAGALSGGFSALAGPLLGRQPEVQFAGRILIGGIASRLGGDKFSNGAITAAFEYLFNDLGHPRQRGYEPTFYDDGTVCNAPTTCSNWSGAVEPVYPLESLVGGAMAGKAAVYGVGFAFSGGSNSVFWSGYTLGALDTAQTFGTTLESTLGGRFLSWLNYNVGVRLPDSVWNWAASTFANRASGTAQAVIRAEGRVWTNIEKPILQQRGIPIEYHP
jgi:hypothetical protein